METNDDNNSKDQDHLNPTPQPSQEEKTNYEPDLSHEELIDRMDNYKSIAASKNWDDPSDYFEIEGIKQEYLDQIDKKEKDRTLQDVHYGQGIRAGLPHTDMEDIKYDQNIQDREFRNQVAKEAKEAYQKNSLTKDFKDKDKEPDMDI